MKKNHLKVIATKASHEKPPVLILGTGITVLGLVRSLGMAGIPSYCLSKNPEIEAYSRWYRTLPESELIAEGEPLNSFLENVNIGKAVLIPCNDHWTHKVASLTDSLKESFLTSQSELETLKLFTDKASFAKTLTQCRIQHPGTIPLEDENDIPDFTEKTLLNYFLKPRDSQSFNAHFKRKAFSFSSRDECKRLIKKCQQAGLKMVLQRYIKGDSSNHYFIEGVVDKGGIIRAAFARRRLRMFPPKYGNTSTMISIDPEPLRETIEGLQRLFTKTQYRGIYSAEYKQDAHDKSYKLLEINARAWWYNEFSTHCGLNIAKLAYDDALGKNIPTAQTYAVGQRFTNGYNEICAVLAENSKMHEKIQELAKTFSSSRFVVASKEDPLPGLMWITKSGIRRAHSVFNGKQVQNPTKAASTS